MTERIGLTSVVDGYLGESEMLKQQKKLAANESAAAFLKDHIDVPPLDKTVFEKWLFGEISG